MSGYNRLVPRTTMLRCTIACGLLSAFPLLAQNCANTSTGRTPLSELTGTYQGFPGGLYGNGANTAPPAHDARALAAAAAVQPLDAAGSPSASGRIVLLSIGMSNTTQEFSTWVPQANADPNKDPAVTLVDGAQGGQTAAIIQNPNANFWTVVQQRLTAAGVTAAQVQAVWLKEADAQPTAAFPAHAQTLQQELAQVARNLKTKYPNVRLCFCSSRTYAGYATTALNPEPFAYESGFAVQWLIGQQSGGDPNLNPDPAAGAVVAPVLVWGPYLWADGTTPRADGLVWLCSDFQTDGTHPSPAGRQKVAGLLQQTFTTSPYATPWYVGSGPAGASFLPYGAGCPGANGVPSIVSNSLPRIGNTNFRVGVENAAPGRLSLLCLSAGVGMVPIAGPCNLLIDPQVAYPVMAAITNVLGRAIVPLGVPPDPQLAGLEVFAQWAVDDPTGTPLPPLGGLAGSRGAQIRVGP
jgi:lysophospholipase L1-like esterase